MPTERLMERIAKMLNEHDKSVRELERASARANEPMLEGPGTARVIQARDAAVIASRDALEVTRVQLLAFIDGAFSAVHS